MTEGTALQGTIDILEIFRGRADVAQCQTHSLLHPSLPDAGSLLLSAQISQSRDQTQA